LESTVEAMEQLGAGRGRILAAIGPLIRQHSYEVGNEFVERFIEADAEIMTRVTAKDLDKVFDLISSLRSTGLTVLLIEQNVALALEIADKATVLANGEVALAGSAAELYNSDLVRQAYLGA